MDLCTGGWLVHHWLDVPASPRPSCGRPDAVQALVPNPPDGEEVGHGGVHVRPQGAPQWPRPGEHAGQRVQVRGWVSSLRPGPAASCLPGSSQLCTTPMPASRTGKRALARPFCALCRCRSSEIHLPEPPRILPLVRANCPSKRDSSLFLFLLFARASTWNQTFCSRMWAWQVASPGASLFSISVGERQPLCAALGRPGGQRRLAPWEGSVCSGGFQPSFLEQPRSGGLLGSCR